MLLWAMAIPPAAWAAPARNVLVLYSYSRLLPANVEADRAFGETFAARPELGVEMFAEFLDRPRFGGEAYERAVAASLREKYAGLMPEVVIAAGEEALGFLLRHRAEVFPQAPILHLSVTPEFLAAAEPLPVDVVGVPADFDFVNTVEQARRWHPQRQHLVVVTGTSTWGRAWERRIRSLAASLSPGLKVEFLAGLPTGELEGRLRGLPDDAFVFSPGYFLDGAGQAFMPRESVKLIAAASAAPVYSPYASLLGTGIVGGYSATFADMARLGARAVLELLAGATPASIALPATMPMSMHVDWRQIRRWGIEPRDLRADTVLHFREPTFWEANRQWLLIAGAVVLLQAGFIAALLLERRRRRRTAAALALSEQHMSLAAGAAGLSMWALDLAPRRDAPTADAPAPVATPHVLVDFAFTLERIHPPDRDRVDEAIRTASASGEDFDVEYRIVAPDGTLCWQAARGRADPVQPQRLIGVVSDITQRRLAETAAAQDHAALQHMTRVALLGQLSASIAHQLNQPLASILGNAEAAQKMLQREPLDLPELRDICADIVAEDQRAADVIRRLGALFRRSPPALAPLDVNELVRDTGELTRTNLLLHQVALVTTLAPDLPLLEGDRVQLQQMLLNLIVNAADAMNTLPETGRVMTISSALEAGLICLCVADRGPGVPAAAMDKLFEPFWSTKAEGMGIGLAVCRSIVAAHHGTLDVANAPDGGAVFCVRLPVRAAP